MSITTYADLKNAVASRLRRSDTSGYIDDWITLAETDIYRRLRTKDMETALSVAISSGVAALPTSYLELKYAYVVFDDNYYSCVAIRELPDSLC